nr:hypothetical protein [Staphylococcus sp. KG4-3]MDW8561506.1 hypothetical protein [Staphylococcus sp. KG4-3]
MFIEFKREYLLNPNDSILIVAVEDFKILSLLMMSLLANYLI